MIFDMTKRKTGDTVYQTPYSGVMYTKNVEQTIVPIDNETWRLSNMVAAAMYAGATHLETIKLTLADQLAWDNTRAKFFKNCTALKSIIINMPVTYLTGVQIFNGCTALESITIGGVDKPFIGTDVSSTIFNGMTSIQSLTMYVDAATLADIPAKIKDYAPFGATNATVTYINSNTGEVITA